MLKVSKNFSIVLSLVISVFFFLCCIAGLFIMPGLVKILITLQNQLPGHQDIAGFSSILVLIASYGILADVMAADIMLFTLLLRIRKRLVFHSATVSLIRGVSWCCLLLCAIFCFLGIYFQLSFIVALCALFLGICLRVCKNAFEEAVSLKEENELTI